MFLHPCLLSALAGCAGDDAPATGDDTTAAGSTSSSSTGSADASIGTESGVDATSSGDGGTTTGGVVAPIGTLKVMTFNVMCSSCTPEGFEPWAARVPYIGDTIRRHDPDLLGSQELFTAAEVAQIEAELPGYTSIWWAAPDSDSLDYADAAIFYRSELFEEVEHGFYWLSPTPDTPYSNGFANPQLPRLLVWARLRVLADDTELVFATTHFDNNAPSQELSAPLVLERTASLASEVPVVLVGDFNSKPDTMAYAILTGGVEGSGPRFDDAFVLSPEWSADTNLDPAPDYDPSMRIDHVFVAGAPWQAAHWVVDQWGYGETEHYTSDHFAIAIELTVPAG